MKFFLDFKSDGFGRVLIDEPIGSDGIDFSLKQKPAGMGRDISFSGGEIQFEFVHLRDHYLKQLLYYNRKFGFESVVVLTIEIDENNSYKCDLDFATAETDDLEYFKCKGIEDGKLQIVKARKSVKVNLLSDKDIDGNPINPLIPENILLLAKPIIQTSKWEQIGDFSTNNGTGRRVFNPAQNLVKSGLEDSFVPFQIFPFSISQFKVLTLKNNVKKLTLKYKINKLFFTNSQDLIGNDVSKCRLVLLYGLTISTAKIEYLFNRDFGRNDSTVINFNSQIILQGLNRGDNIWFYFESSTLQNYNNQPIFNSEGFEFEFEGESIAYNSISKSIRLVDVMRQVVRSISGLEINAPRFEALGEFFDNRLVNGNFLRNITDRAFNVSLEDIEKSLTEMRGDWEIGSDGKVFFGIEKDFYTTAESGFFDNTQFSQMSKTFNEKYKVNEFFYKYNKFQSQKENEEANSSDTIHGQSKLVFFNKNVENKKEVEIEWIRDAFLIEQARRKSIEISDNTASQEDDDLFCIDSINTTFSNTFTEVTELQHTFDVSAQKLNIRNNGSVNFINLGIAIDSILIIQPTDVNAGTYRVFSIENNSIVLTRLLGFNTSAGDGVRLTRFTYELTANFAPFTNYTNQGFSETENLASAQNFINRRYSIARNIYNYYQSYLATCNLYWKNKPLKNTWYKNNGEYTAKYDGVKLKENADLIPLNPILAPIIYNQIIFANVSFNEYIALQNDIRSERGFIRTIDNSDQVVKIYPIDMEYKLLEKELIIKAEEKFEPNRMTISTQFDYVLVNNETRVQSLIYDFDFEKLHIYDENRFRLYNGVYWNEVNINGAIPNSIEQLKEWMSLVN